MIKTIIEIWSNWRFWSLFIIATLPLWLGFIACGVVWIQEIIENNRNR